jgi:hypothetical protein
LGVNLYARKTLFLKYALKFCNVVALVVIIFKKQLPSLVRCVGLVHNFVGLISINYLVDQNLSPLLILIDDGARQGVKPAMVNFSRCHVISAREGFKPSGVQGCIAYAFSLSLPSKLINSL